MKLPITPLKMFLFAALFLCGCASFDDTPKAVILKHPQTQDFVNCNVDKWETKESFAENERCIKEYEDKGYVIWGSR